nr:MAG TPA: hypothetical protein [Caudoviricetes sp.]
MGGYSYENFFFDAVSSLLMSNTNSHFFKNISPDIVFSVH